MQNISGNSLIVKEVNMNLVRKVLKEKEQATKQQIAAVAGLSVMTVGTVLQQLIKQNEVLEAELSVSNGGRPAQQFKYNADYAFVLVLYPYETNGHIVIRSALVNLLGRRVVEKEHVVKDVDLESLEEIIDKYLAAYPAIRAIGLGLPGVEYDGKMIVSDYKALLGVSIIDYFSARYKMPVIMENDVNAAVIGFASTVPADGATIVYLYFPEKYPPGAGVFIDGSLYKGKRNFAGEIANMPLDIAWVSPGLYKSFSQSCQAVAKLTIAVSCVLNPDAVVLQGNFLTEKHLLTIKQKLSALLPPNAVPKLELAADFSGDFRRGMIVQTLATLEPSIVLSRK